MKTKITFTLPAANCYGAGECILLGEFNNWNSQEGIKLQQQPDGSLQAELELVAGKDYQYRYLLGNGIWVNDEAEKVIAEYMGYPVENCIVRVLEIKGKTKEQQPKATKPKATKSKAAVKLKPTNLKDDLTKVEGIGKKIEALLNKNKIQSFKELAKATGTTLKTILESGGNKFSMHNPGTWPKQAKLAAAAKWEELESLQQQLKGGK